MAKKKFDSDIEVKGYPTATGYKVPTPTGAFLKDDGSTATALTEADVVGTPRQFTRQQNFSEQTLTDAATLSWDLDTQQGAYLLATSAVGNTRTLPNSTITAGVNGGNYQLVFQQDATGGRSIIFDTSFEVVGDFDLRPDKVSIILLTTQGSAGRVVITNWEGITVGLSNAGAGEFLLLNDKIKSLREGTGISLSSTDDEVTITATGGGGGSSVMYGAAFIDAVNGDDATALLQDPSKPFATMAAALTALPAYDPANQDHWTLHFTTLGTYYFPTTALPARNLTFYSDKAVTLQNTTGSAVTSTYDSANYTRLIFDVKFGAVRWLEQGANWFEVRNKYLYFWANELEDLHDVINYGCFYGASPLFLRINYAKVNGSHLFYFFNNASAIEKGLQSVDVEIGNIFWDNAAQGWTNTLLIMDWSNYPTMDTVRSKIKVGSVTFVSGRLITLYFCEMEIGNITVLAGGNQPSIGWIDARSILRFNNTYVVGSLAHRMSLLRESVITGIIRKMVHSSVGNESAAFTFGEDSSAVDLIIHDFDYTGSLGSTGTSGAVGIFRVIGFTAEQKHFRNVTVVKSNNIHGLIIPITGTLNTRNHNSSWFGDNFIHINGANAILYAANGTFGTNQQATVSVFGALRSNVGTVDAQITINSFTGTTY